MGSVTGHPRSQRRELGSPEWLWREIFGAPEGVEGGGDPEADEGVGDGDAREDEDAEAGEENERGVEAGAGRAEEAAGEAFGEECQGEDAEREGDTGGGGEDLRAVRSEEAGDAHAEGHEPVEEGGLFEVADAVGVERDGIVAEKHFAGDFNVDRVGVVEERGAEQGEAGVEEEPEKDGGEECGVGPLGYGGGHWG